MRACIRDGAKPLVLLQLLEVQDVKNYVRIVRGRAVNGGLAVSLG
jgi:hypothetical protein